VLPIFDIWSNEVNLEIIDKLCVSEGQLGMLPMESTPKAVAMAVYNGLRLFMVIPPNFLICIVP